MHGIWLHVGGDLRYHCGGTVVTGGYGYCNLDAASAFSNSRQWGGIEAAQDFEGFKLPFGMRPLPSFGDTASPDPPSVAGVAQVSPLLDPSLQQRHQRPNPPQPFLSSRAVSNLLPCLSSKGL